MGADCLPLLLGSRRAAQGSLGGRPAAGAPEPAHPQGPQPHTPARRRARQGRNGAGDLHSPPTSPRYGACDPAPPTRPGAGALRRGPRVLFQPLLFLSPQPSSRGRPVSQEAFLSFSDTQ